MTKHFKHTMNADGGAAGGGKPLDKQLEQAAGADDNVQPQQQEANNTAPANPATPPAKKEEKGVPGRVGQRHIRG